MRRCSGRNMVPCLELGLFGFSFLICVVHCCLFLSNQSFEACNHHHRVLGEHIGCNGGFGRTIAQDVMEHRIISYLLRLEEEEDPFNQFISSTYAEWLRKTNRSTRTAKNNENNNHAAEPDEEEMVESEIVPDEVLRTHHPLLEFDDVDESHSEKEWPHSFSADSLFAADDNMSDRHSVSPINTNNSNNNNSNVRNVSSAQSVMPCSPTNNNNNSRQYPFSNQYSQSLFGSQLSPIAQPMYSSSESNARTFPFALSTPQAWPPPPLPTNLPSGYSMYAFSYSSLVCLLTLSHS